MRSQVEADRGDLEGHRLLEVADRLGLEVFQSFEVLVELFVLAAVRFLDFEFEMLEFFVLLIQLLFLFIQLVLILITCLFEFFKLFLVVFEFGIHFLLHFYGEFLELVLVFAQFGPEDVHFFVGLR